MIKFALKSPVRQINATAERRSLPVDALVVYPEVQRLAPSKASINDLLSQFDHSKLGVMTVNHRKDGTFSLLDGQRRAAVLKIRGESSMRVECSVYTGLTPDQEAEMFLGLNNRRVVSSVDRFFIGLTAGHADCVGVVKVCERHGWAVGRRPSAQTAACTESMKRVWNMDKTGTLLDRVIEVLTNVFGRDKTTLSGHVVEGLGRFIRHREGVDIARLQRNLQARCATVAPLVAYARQRRETEGGSVAANVEAVIDRIYGSRKVRT